VAAVVPYFKAPLLQTAIAGVTREVEAEPKSVDAVLSIVTTNELDVPVPVYSPPTYISSPATGAWVVLVINAQAIPFVAAEPKTLICDALLVLASTSYRVAAESVTGEASLKKCQPPFRSAVAPTGKSAVLIVTAVPAISTCVELAR